jgi:hypothetical protein
MAGATDEQKGANDAQRLLRLGHLSIIKQAWILSAGSKVLKHALYQRNIDLLVRYKKEVYVSAMITYETKLQFCSECNLADLLTRFLFCGEPRDDHHHHIGCEAIAVQVLPAIPADLDHLQYDEWHCDEATSYTSCALYGPVEVDDDEQVPLLVEAPEVGGGNIPPGMLSGHEDGDSPESDMDDDLLSESDSDREGIPRSPVPVPDVESGGPVPGLGGDLIVEPDAESENQNERPGLRHPVLGPEEDVPDAGLRRSRRKRKRKRKA